MAKYTALEWFYEQTVINHKTNYYELFEQAKKMEKDQIYDSFCSGAWYENQNIDKSADLYYNETYGE